MRIMLHFIVAAKLQSEVKGKVKYEALLGFRNLGKSSVEQCIHENCEGKSSGGDPDQLVKKMWLTCDGSEQKGRSGK